MPDLEELKHKMKGEKFRILAVNSGDSAIKVRSFIDQYPYSFDIVLDENRDITKLLKIVGLPTTFILNRDLKIMGKVMGPINWKDDVFIEYLKKFSRT
jgi:peroxiredoxin